MSNYDFTGGDAERIARFAKMFPQTVASWMKDASEHITLQTYPDAALATVRSPKQQMSDCYPYFGPQGATLDELEPSEDSDDIPDERKGWSHQEWDEAQAEERAGWEP